MRDIAIAQVQLGIEAWFFFFPFSLPPFLPPSLFPDHPTSLPIAPTLASLEVTFESFLGDGQLDLVMSYHVHGRLSPNAHSRYDLASSFVMASLVALAHLLDQFSPFFRFCDRNACLVRGEAPPPFDNEIRLCQGHLHRCQSRTRLRISTLSRLYVFFFLSYFSESNLRISDLFSRPSSLAARPWTDAHYVDLILRSPSILTRCHLLNRRRANSIGKCLSSVSCASPYWGLFLNAMVAPDAVDAKRLLRGHSLSHLPLQAFFFKCESWSDTTQLNLAECLRFGPL